MNRNTTTRTTRRTTAAVLAALGLLGVGAATAAASDPSYGPDPTPPATDAAATDTAAANTAGAGTAAPGTAAAGDSGASGTTIDPDAVVRFSESDLGTILVDNAGMTLYAFLNDTDGESTCVDDCATNWPPMFVEGDAPDVGNLDAKMFSTVEHPDGAVLKFGDWPLYRFAGDAAPGEINGQGVGDVWYVVGPIGAPVTLVNTRESDLGTILVNAQGLTLYGFTPDTEGESTCVDDCAAAWPPALVGEADVSLLDPERFSTVEHPSGTMLKIGDWPLYTFANDAAPGDVNGQGVGDVWYVVAPDGTLIEGTGDAGTEGTAAEAPATTG